LTYHASGDRALTQAMLDVLRSHDVQVTVFAVGTWLAANPDLGSRIVAEGHELGNHTKTHKSMGSLGPAVLAAEIDGGGQALVPFIGGIGRWFRPSGIVVPTASILAQAGRTGYAYSIGYDLDTLDFQDPGANAVVANLQRGLQPGSIVSMHFGHQGTVEATPRILQHLDSVGLRHVTLSELFDLHG
jgi:peptidoglycan/xylan/chitin deacetylase (PgdA/CDA1 family)